MVTGKNPSRNIAVSENEVPNSDYHLSSSDNSIVVDIYCTTIWATPIIEPTLTPRPTHKPANSYHAALELES